MGKIALILGVLLPLGACASGGYEYTTSTASYAAAYPPDYPLAYGYGDVEPSYLPPPFWASGLQLEFDGERRQHFRHERHEWDRGG